MRIKSTHQLIICSLAPSPATAPFDSCRNRVPDQQNLYLNSSYYRSKTTAAQWLQDRTLGWVFALQMICIMIQNGEAFVWILDLYKSVVVVTMLTEGNSK